jgi:hypothetical protein
MRDLERPGSDLIRALDDWARSGAVWRVVARRPSGATVALLRCDAGEEVDRITSSDPTWLAYLDEHPSSEG